MRSLPLTASDEEILALADEWVALMAAGDYDGAFAFTAQDDLLGYSPQILRRVIEEYNEARPGQRVTVNGTGEPQRREMVRREVGPCGDVGDVWYDLYIDGVLSQLTATFYIMQKPGGLILQLANVEVM